MRVYRRLRVAALAATLIAVLSAGSANLAGTSLADGPCPNGTSWDNITHTCR